MKNSLKRSWTLIFSLPIAAMACLLSSSVARADETWGGGSGQWDVDNTADWNGSTWTEGYNTGTSTVTNSGNVADFTTAGGTVTVDDTQAGGSVAASYLYFNNNNNGAYTLTGNTIYTDDVYGGNMIDVDSASGAVTIDSNIVNAGTPTTGTNSAPVFGSDNQVIQNNSSNDLTLNGTVTYNSQTTLFVSANGSGKIIFNGGVLQASGSGLYLTGGGTVEFGASSDMSSLDSAFNGRNLSLVLGAGTAVLDADTFGATSAFESLGGNGIFLNGAFTGTQLITDERSSGVLGGVATVASGWSGNIYLDNLPATTTLSQVAGGRFTYSGDIYGNNLTYLITSGDGTVVISNNSTYTQYTNNQLGVNGQNLAADLKAKVTLITNSNAGSAFGGGAPSNIGIVQVEANALLGGTGTSTQKVVAMAATSIITAGDPGDAGLGIAPNIGTLHLTGGLEADNGVTLDFKLDGSGDSDVIDLGSGTLTLNGTVTVNFSSVDGSVMTGTPYYDLITGEGSWTDGDSTKFVFTAPAGYELDPTYGADGTQGYIFDTSEDEFSVEFVAAPEPSTYALLGLGLLALAAISRFRKLNS